MTVPGQNAKPTPLDASTNRRGKEFARRALLPEGFHDDLAPVAEQHAGVVTALMGTFLDHGYDQVRPPLVEFEDSLFSGAGQAKASQSFRFMDPDTQKGLAVRADITPQISRLAATRLADAPRPLRLAYSGPVLRVVGSQIRPTREFMQAGIELIGSDALAADQEVICLAVAALQAVGLEDVSVDLTIAPFGRLLMVEAGLDDEQQGAALKALSARDTGGLKALGFDEDTPLGRVVSSSGDVDATCALFDQLELPNAARALLETAQSLAAALKTCLPGVAVSLDPCETHGFEYKSGVGFALFSARSRSELGRGGRYQVDFADGTSETATGFSAYLDSLVNAVPAQDPPRKIFVPLGADKTSIETLQASGWRTVQGFSSDLDAEQEARRLHLAAYWDGDAIRLLESSAD